MTLEETIKHYEEKAEAEERNAKLHQRPDRSVKGSGKRYLSCLECAKEHRQLAEWLRELKKWRDFGNNIGRVLGKHFSEEELFKMMEVNTDENKT